MAQSLAEICVHIAFSTKGRVPWLAAGGIREEMHAYLASVFKAYDARTLLIGGMADHVHILFLLPRTGTMANVIGEAKRSSSKWIKTKGPEWAEFQWQAGYGAFSISHSHIPRVRAYIESQEERHRKRTFQDEYRDLLRKHEIVFDERYVWE